MTFDHVGKTVWLERLGWMQNQWPHNLVNKQLQYTYCPISHEGKQTMKLGQLIEYNKRNIILQKLCRKWCRHTSPRPFFIF